MAAKDKQLQKSYFDVLGICCSSEVRMIENILRSLEGVKEISVIVPTRTVIVVHDALLVSPLEIVKALNRARLEANVRANGVIKYQKKWPSPFAMACGILLLLSFLKYAYHPLHWLAVGAVAVGIYPIVLKGIAAIRSFRLDINILMLIAVIGSLAMKDFTEAATIVFLFTTADWLESRATHKATAAMSSLMSIAPQRAVVSETGEEVDVNEVKLNTILAVRAGEVIPIDGVVVDGKCEVDEKTLTGESLPVTKERDSTVWAGTMNLNGYISVKTTAVAEDCVVAKMAKLVEEAQNSKSGTQRFIDKCAQFYTPAIIIISAAIAVIPAACRVHNLNHWFHLALVVLVSACPCALILSTPVASFCALTKAAKSGLLVKGSDYLEILSKIRITAFDKTGTLSRGEFVVTEFQSLCEDISLNTLLYWVASVESKSSHPMAAALVEFGRSQSVEPKPETVEDYQNFPGEGIYGRIDGRDMYIGNRKISVRAHGTVPSLEGNMKEGKTMGYVFSGASPVGIFSLSDACRTGAAEAVNELKSMGIKSAMLTGDNQAAAMHVQEQLGNCLNVVHAELLPEDKARIIEELKKEGPTAMIGDGINDAPALATADIGISMGISGSALATETGNVILMSNDIRKIPKAIQLARKAHRKVIENVILSISTKGAILALAFAGHPLVWAAVLADVGTCLLVIINSMLLLRGTHVHAGKCSRSSDQSCSKNQSSQTGCCQSSCDRACIDKIVQKDREPKRCSSQMCASKCQSSTVKSDSCSNSSGCNKCADSASTQDGSIKKACESKKCSSKGCASKHQSSTLISDSCSNSSGANKCTDSASSQDGSVKKGCEPKRCSSQKCASKCQSSTLKLDSCLNSSGDNKRADSESTHEAKHCDQGTCNDHKIEAKYLPGNCCSGHHSSGLHTEDKQSKANCCAEPNDLQGANHCHQGHLHHSSSLEEERQETKNGHCHSHSDQPCCTNYDDNQPPHTVIDIPKNLVHEAVHACCSSLEKREYGGCCGSYRKECCGKHGHFGPGFGGGLTEIVTE